MTITASNTLDTCYKCFGDSESANAISSIPPAVSQYYMYMHCTCTSVHCIWLCVDVVDGLCRSVNVDELEMASRHHQLVSLLATANENVQRASVVTTETLIAANKASVCVSR